eukprot:s1976_g5.t3
MVTHVHAVNGECALIVQLLDQYDCSGLLCKKEIVEESVPDNEVQEPAPRFSASAWRERSMQKDPSGAEESQESDEHMDGACSERTTDEGLEEACDVGAELEEPSEDGQESESKVPPSQQGGRTSEDTYNATASDFPQLPMAWAAESKLPQQDSTPSKAPPDLEEDPWQVLEDREAMAWAAESKLPQQDSTPSKVRGREAPPDVEEDPWQVLEDRDAMAWAAESKLPQQDSAPSKVRAKKGPPDVEEDPWQVLEDREAMAWAAESKLPQQDSSPSKARGREAPRDLEEDPWQVLEDREAMAWAAESKLPQQDSTPSKARGREAPPDLEEEDLWRVLDRNLGSSWTQQDDVRTDKLSDDPDVDAAQEQSEADAWQVLERQEAALRAEASSRMQENETRLTDSLADQDLRVAHEQLHERKQSLSVDLPIDALREEILQAVRAERVTILVGATGCGKSTRLPQFLMDEPGAKVLVTQPRRVAAVEIARRVASERGERIGQNVGYRISGETVRGSGKLQFATIGYVLTWFLAKPEHFGSFTHVVIDEVHERAADMEMFLLLTKLLMYFFKRPKVVLMSATLQPEEFGNYFSDFVCRGGTAALSVSGRTFPVQEIFLDDLVSDYQDLLPGTVYSLVEAAAEQFQRAWEDGDLESPSVLEGLPELAVQLVPFFAKKDSTLLVFMPGLLELSNLSKMFTPEALKSFPTSHRETSPSNYEVFVLHSMVPRSEQERVFKQPSDGKCHIVLASNIAESSITFLKLEMNDLSGNYFPENQHPWRSVRLSPMQSAPLLKFENERAKLFEEGLAVLEALPGPVCPIAFVGDGRSGKSFLASKLVGAGTFREDDSDEAVTEGIDIATMSCHPGHLLILDCEGGNNAMSKSHSIVTVVGALFATALIFVTDGKASEAAVEALGRMLEERALIKCDGTGSLQAQTLLFVVNQNRLRYGEDALEKILAADHGAERKEIRTLISNAYPEHRRQFFTIPVDNKKDFEDKWESFHGAMRNAAVPLKMGKLWMTGSQVVHMLRRVEEELRTRGKVSLPSLHRHVILDGWLKPTVGQVLQSRMDKLLENFSQEELATQKVGSVDGSCTDCQKSAAGWLDPDVEEFFCEDCWRKFSPKVLKCCFCGNFHPWILGRVEKVTKMWHCNDCLMQLGIEIPHAESAPRVTAVIDFALRREPVYDHNQGLTCLTTSWCSQASARQRSGRAGRTQPGIAIRLVTRSFFEGKMPEFDMPEILRTSTAKLFLRAKKLSQVLQKTSATFSPDCPLDLRSARSLIGSLPQPPKMKLLKAAVKELAQTSALAAADEAAEITSLALSLEVSQRMFHIKTCQVCANAHDDACLDVVQSNRLLIALQRLTVSCEVLGIPCFRVKKCGAAWPQWTDPSMASNPRMRQLEPWWRPRRWGRGSFCAVSTWYSQEQLVAEIEMLRSSASIAEEEAPIVQKGTEEPSKENPAELLQANAVNYGEFSEDPFSEDVKHDDDPPSFLPVSSMDHASQGSWMGARPYDDEDVVPAQSPVPCGSPHGELAEPSAEPVADAPGMRMPGPGLEFRRQEKVLAPELPGSIAEDSAGSEGAWKGPGAEQPEVPPKAEEDSSPGTGVAAEEELEPATEQEQSSQLEVPEPKDSDLHGSTQVGTAGNMDEAPSAVEADVAMEADPGVEEYCEGELAELREQIFELQEAVASKDQTVAAQQQMLEGKSNDLKALEDQIALLQATVTDLKASIAEQPGNLQEPCWPDISRIVSSCLQERLKAAECRENDHMIQSLQVELSRSLSDKAASQQHWEEQVLELKRVVAEKDAEMTALRTSQLGRQEEDLT